MRLIRRSTPRRSLLSAVAVSFRISVRLALGCMAAPLIGVGLSTARAEIATPVAPAPVTAQLMLQVHLNGYDLGVVILFNQASDGRLSATRGELEAIRIVHGAGNASDQIALDSIPGLSAHYDDQRQSIDLKIDAARLAAQSLNAWSGASNDDVEVGPGRGILLNYNLFAAGLDQGRLGFSTASAALDGRFYGPFGTVAASSIVFVDRGRFSGTRLETRWTRVLPGRDMIASVGDGITGSTAWSRPIRFGGIQLQKNFMARPDLVTIPFPGITGSALVPSALDVYVNGAQVMSTNVSEGRFIVDNLPAVTGGGQARVVMRDAQGREVETLTPYYVSQRLLRTGFSEFSVEAGIPRFGFGTASNDYRGPIFASATGRRGLSDAVTLDGRMEASPDLLLVGIGATVRTGAFGVGSFAAAASVAEKRTGGFLYFSYEGQWRDIRFTADASRSVGNYLDLAALSLPAPDARFFTAGRLLSAVLPPRRTQRVTVSAPLPMLSGSLAFNFANEERRGEGSFRIASASFDRSIFGIGSASVSAFKNIGQPGSGLFVNLSVAIGARARVQAGVTRDPTTGIAKSFEASQAVSTEPGSFGWQLSALDGPVDIRSAAASYQTRAGLLRGQITDVAGRRFANISFDGALVLDRSLFATSRIVNGFAIVDAKAANVPVAFENRPVGRTDARGLALVTEVRPFQVNRVSLDVAALPMSVIITEPEKVFRPMTFDGVRITYNTTTINDQVLLHLVDESGADLPSGTNVVINGGAPVVVGFDGLVLAESVMQNNVIDVVGPSSPLCRIRFQYAASSSTSKVVGPLVCTPLQRYAGGDGQ